MASTNLDIVRSAYEAFTTRQLQKILDLAAPDLEVVQSTALPWGGSHHGIAGLRQFLIRLTQHLDSVMTPELLIDAGDQVVAVGHTRGTVRGNNRSFDLMAVHVWTVRGGKLTRFEAYVDHRAMLAALDPATVTQG